MDFTYPDTGIHVPTHKYTYTLAHIHTCSTHTTYKKDVSESVKDEGGRMGVCVEGGTPAHEEDGGAEWFRAQWLIANSLGSGFL